MENRATSRILLSIDGGLEDHDFKCIITSPFTRCLQTAEVVRIMLGIRPEDIFINYNLREADSALSRYVPIKYRGPEWNTPEPYNQGLIAEIAKGGIEPYVKQTVDNIFNKYKHLGNVLFITHGDVYNEYAPKIPETDIGASSLEEAGWAIFEPPSNVIVSHAGEGFFNTL
jgi:broad specificity phosphatase PhoE